MEKLEGTWVVAVSGGADSMALLDMCYQNNMDIVVAHVNYQKRESAKRDEKGVESYCHNRNIPFFKHVVDSYEKGNFQAIARKIRYAFFKEIVESQNAKGVLVAHHLDDVLETYIMQKKRKSIPEYYGIAKETKIYGVRVCRLLLEYTKADLETYCEKHNVPYFLDESNLEDDYTRNKIRHEQIEQMSVQNKKDMVKCIQQDNERLQKEMSEVRLFCENKDTLMQEELLTLEELFLCKVLRCWIIKHTGYHSISMKYLLHISELIKKKENWIYPVRSKFQLVCEYGVMKIESTETYSFYHVFQKVEYMKTEHFETCDHGKKIEGVFVRDEDFPLVIRNYHSGDKIELRYGTKKVSRFFIDRKIAKKERELWPVLVNNMGKIIFVCGIGCDISHYSNNFNMFVVK